MGPVARLFPQNRCSLGESGTDPGLGVSPKKQSRSGLMRPGCKAGPHRVFHDYESVGPLKVGRRFSRREATPSWTSGPPNPIVS